MRNLICFCSLWIITFVHPLFGVMGWSGAVSSTPSKFAVNIRRVSFRNQAGEWVTYVDRLFTMDIASQNPGSAIGSAGVGASLHPGTYSAMMFHIAPTFTVSASVSDVGNGFAAYTNSSNLSTQSVGQFGEMWLASVTNGTPTPTDLTIQMPVTSQAQSQMENSGMQFETIDGQIYMKAIMDFGSKNFKITSTNARMPIIQMNFDVTNAVDFFLVQDLGLNSIVAVMPAGPGLTLYLDNDLVFSMNH